jgi:ABC-type Mn2+/Zn2+ transport system permease subunit
MISLWWSFALTAVGVTGLFFVYRSQSLLGPAIGVAVQVAWIAYAVSTRQWWFLLSAFAYGGTNLYGIQKRRREAKGES